MADFDEYKYLEEQFEQKENNGKGVVVPTATTVEKSRQTRTVATKSTSRTEKKEEKRRSRSRENKKIRKRRSRSRSHGRSRRSRRDRDERIERRRRSPIMKREPTPPEVRAARERERELKELERDTRTIFAYNLNLKADERDLFDFFSKAGKVIDVKIIMDRNTRKSKGFAYVEFENQEDVLNALALTGQLLMGQAVMVKASEAEKNLAWEAQQQQQQNQAAAAALMGSGLGTSGPCKLYISGLHRDLSESDMKRIFTPFGELDFIQLIVDAAGKSQGYGYVQFKQMSDATKAMQQLNGLDIGGSIIQLQIAAVSSAEFGAITYGELDEEDEPGGGGMRLSSHARAALMNRLANSAGLQTGSLPGHMPQIHNPSNGNISSINNPLIHEQGILGPSAPRPTQCLLVKNMFDPEVETDPDWVKDIEDDVKEECLKYGDIIHIHVDSKSKGFVYMMFNNTESSSAAQKALHGRWFAGRQIVAEFQFVQMYKDHFKC